jgi:hypothetical protein
MAYRYQTQLSNKNNIKTMKEFFYDETGKLSMKRVCGLLCTLALCVTMYVNSFSPAEHAPAPVLVQAVAALAFGCLGLSSFDKFTASKSKKGDS